MTKYMKEVKMTRKARCQRPFQPDSLPSAKSKLCMGSGTDDTADVALPSCPSSAECPAEVIDCNSCDNTYVRSINLLTDHDVYL